MDNNNSGKTLLVVEDHVDTQMLMKQILKRDGYVVHTVGSGEEAGAHLKENPAPDIILLDLTLPQMTGEEFMCELRNNSSWKDIQVLVISGWDDLSERAAAAGANGSLKKPFSISDFHRQLDHIFSKDHNPSQDLGLQ